jgi:hypothetical protein
MHSDLEQWDGGKHIHGYTEDPYTCTMQSCQQGPSTVWIYHNSFAGGGWAVDVGPETPNVHIINNLFSAQGVASGPASWGEFNNNLEAQIWRSDTIPDFTPPSQARNAGRTLSNLPGMTAAYFGDGKPDIGALQAGGSVNPTPPLAPPQRLRQVGR